MESQRNVERRDTERTLGLEGTGMRARARREVREREERERDTTKEYR